MIKIAIHQANFCPWYPFFYKMAMVDKFILLNNVQFEKNGFQNRFKYKDKWMTKPVKSGMCRISEKEFTDGNRLLDINLMWIEAIKDTLSIKAELVDDYIHKLEDMSFDDPTDRLIDLIKWHEGDVYVTNPEAKDKYLNEDKMRDAGIKIEYCVVPRNLRKHTFEIFEEFGIEGAIKQLPKKEIPCKV